MSELPGQWSGKPIYDELELIEDDLSYCQNQIMNALEEKREELQSQRRMLHEEEEEIRFEYQRQQMLLQREGE